VAQKKSTSVRKNSKKSSKPPAKTAKKGARPKAKPRRPAPRKAALSIKEVSCGQCVYSAVVVWCGHPFDDVNATMAALYAPRPCARAALDELRALLAERCQCSVPSSFLKCSTTFLALRQYCCGL